MVRAPIGGSSSSSPTARSRPTGTLTVAIASEHSTSPVVYPVFTRAIVGATATATPLRSISSGAPDPVIIGSVEPQPGSEAASARVDAARSTVQVTSTGAGTFYFTFEASTGDRAVTGVLRADFVEPTEESSAVVPMTDVAYLPAGGSVVIDPLANDTDPDGEGLAVREIDLTAAGAGERRGDGPAPGAGVRRPPAEGHGDVRLQRVRR